MLCRAMSSMHGDGCESCVSPVTAREATLINFDPRSADSLGGCPRRHAGHAVLGFDPYMWLDIKQMERTFRA